jgi:hypothetical protein
MVRTFAGVVGALALLILLALPAPSVAAEALPEGIANAAPATEFGAARRRPAARRYAGDRYLYPYPRYYRHYRNYEFPYHFYYRPYLYFGAPYEVWPFRARYYR